MRSETGTAFAETFLAWVFSISFPLGIVFLIFERVYFGHDWPAFVTSLGLVIFGSGLGRLLLDFFVPKFRNRNSQVLRRQSLYSDLWALSAGSWMYWRPWGDAGLIIVITIAVTLWACSHRELLRLYGR